MKKIVMAVTAVVFASSFLAACGPITKQLSENTYAVRADDFNNIPILQFLVPNLGCGTAKERFDEASLKLCQNGFDVKNEGRSGATKADPLCVVFGEIVCRSASSEVK